MFVDRERKCKNTAGFALAPEENQAKSVTVFQTSVLSGDDWSPKELLSEGSPEVKTKAVLHDQDMLQVTGEDLGSGHLLSIWQADV